MHIQTLYIKDFKNIKNQTFDLSSHNGLTLLIGNNGCGKSNVLECISSIFYNLYQKSELFETEFTISYQMYDSSSFDIRYEGKNLIQQPSQGFRLPKRVVAIYSGEEQRMWEKYYAPLYSKYIKEINKQAQGGSWPSMLYLNKYYWDIALLSILCSDAEDNMSFLTNLLGITNIENIQFDINSQNYTNYKESPVLTFIDSLNQNPIFTLENFKALLEKQAINIDTLFMYLYIAFSPKESKILNAITIRFNGNQTIKDLSEGQKKLLLIKAALEFTGSEDTLYLLDEPDAYIHIENKIKLLDIIKSYSNNREIILTTHSPSLADCIMKNSNNIVYMENGEVKTVEVIDAISKLSGNHIGYIEGALILFSSRPLILVEGIGDVNYINKSIELLSRVNPTYSNISCDILFMGGAGENAKQFIDKIRPHINENRKVLVIFDRDDSGAEGMKKIGATGNREDFKTYRDRNWYFLMLPKTSEHKEIDFTIEDYFSLEYKSRIAKEKIDEANGYFKKLPKDLRQNVKDALYKKINEYSAEDMAGFTVLLDKIANILAEKETEINEITIP